MTRLLTIAFCVCGTLVAFPPLAGAASRSVSDIDVRQFGAKGDGVTDDSAAFTAAARRLAEQANAAARRWGNRFREKPSGNVDGPRARIVVPRGRYLLRSTVFFRQHAYVTGEDGAELVGGNPSNDLFSVSAAFRLRMENLTFRGGRHAIMAETRNKECANFRITGCRFFGSADTAVHSPSYRIEDGKGGVAEWNYDPATESYVRNPDYDPAKLVRNNHSTMTVIDNCLFEDCPQAVNVPCDGFVCRGCRVHLPKGSTRPAFANGGVFQELEISHYAGASAFGGVNAWIENCSVMTSDRSGAHVLGGRGSNASMEPMVTLVDVKTDAGLAKGNAICRFKDVFPPVAALIRVTAEGENPVKAFSFEPEESERAFADSDNARFWWPPDRFFSYGVRDCGANIQAPDGYAARFVRQIPGWAGAPGGKDCRFEMPKLEKARHVVRDGVWQVETWTQEIAADTVIEGAGVAALAGLTSDRPWFVVKKGAKLKLKNLMFRGGKSLVVVEDGAEAYVDSCFVNDVEGPVFVCRKGGRLVVDCGVYYASRLYEGEGRALLRDFWFRFTDPVPQDHDLEGVAMVNRGELTVWNMLGVPTVFHRFPVEQVKAEPTRMYKLRVVDNYGRFVARNVRFGNERGGLTGVYSYGDAQTLIEGRCLWYWNRAVPNTPVVCDRPDADVRIFGTNFPNCKPYLPRIELLWNDGGTYRPVTNGQMHFTCPTPEPAGAR